MVRPVNYLLNEDNTISPYYMLNSEVQVAPFIEHPIVDYSLTEPGPFDVTAFGTDQAPGFIIAGKFSLQQYCLCLLHKLFSLPKSQVKPFLQYQCDQLSDPITWLNKFEKLIDLNRDAFSRPSQKLNTEKALAVIEVLRDNLENAGPQKNFDFRKIKQKVKTYSSTEEKLSFLMEARTEYLQNKPLTVDPKEVPFDEKINLEIGLLKDQQKLSKKRRDIFTAQEAKSPLSPPKKSPQSPTKFQINSNLNVFVDIFFQLMHEKKVNGKPYLDASPNELCEMIATYFKDKEGHDISTDTIKTILKPSRFEKRPKGDSRFTIPD